MNLSRSERLMVHLDMNSFFATVEQQANPRLRGKPLGVCAYLGKHGCIIAPSREAKKLGVRVGTTVAEAKRLVPSMAFVQADPPKYRSVIGRVFSFLHELTDQIEHYSIDEAFMDCTGWFCDELALIEPLVRVKQRIRDEIGSELTCSIGVAPTKLLAKLASDYQKPDGFTMVSHASIPSFLAEHNLIDIAGIGEKNRRHLFRLGIFTPLDFIRYPPAHLLRLYGKPMYFLQAGLLGLACDATNACGNSSSQSVGHSYCVPRRANEAGQIIAIFLKLVEKAGQRLRGLRQHAGGVVVTVGSQTPGTPTISFSHHHKDYQSCSRRFSEPCSDSFSLIEASLATLHEIWNGSSAIAFLAVTFTHLTPHTAQLQATGLTQAATTDKRLRLSQAIDRVRERYGMDAVLLGEVLRAHDAAPDRIGFRKTEGVEFS